ncbi:hypothetical protein C7H19_24920 [Aphanothece hegewaldii CCALA 016]|uniref:HepT-like domain-containing protein n=1 Tax=Aphanothece hegewaldii CCALA 016 TaxID=2107694 RepID=A0A2T1LQF1_9CHRO|nr:hypothetical protein [Aphanothece hegewaldii]PSF27683.1 hypothetical protein C7H19_24920 [Aphanothece hegewaldii CCALA 016]
MNSKLLKLAQEIKLEISFLEISIERSLLGWQRYLESNDQLYLDSVALGLHNFYSGLERLFEKVAKVVDGSLPSGANWHQLLLEQISLENPERRPALISVESRKALEEYRGLRHVVRNVYAFQLEPEKLRLLVESAPSIFTQIKTECLAFASFLEH